MRRHVLPAFGDLPLAGIEPSDVSRWVADMVAKGLSPAYVRKAYQLLSGVLTRARHSRYIAASPCVGIDLPRLEHFEMRFLDAEEVRDLAETIAPRYRRWSLPRRTRGSDSVNSRDSGSIGWTCSTG
jgi:integrase